MKYETGLKDKYGNRQLNFVKVFEDMKRVVLGKIKFSKALYNAMCLHFTIAHYDRYGWIHTYNGSWGMLANELEHTTTNYGDFTFSDEECSALVKLVNFLREHDTDVIPVEKMI